jgi:hypothetical protein
MAASCSGGCHQMKPSKKAFPTESNNERCDGQENGTDDDSAHHSFL